jgi:hypothetical protein
MEDAGLTGSTIISGKRSESVKLERRPTEGTGEDYGTGKGAHSGPKQTQPQDRGPMLVHDTGAAVVCRICMVVRRLRTRHAEAVNPLHRTEPERLACVQESRRCLVGFPCSLCFLQRDSEGLLILSIQSRFQSDHRASMSSLSCTGVETGDSER